MAVSKFFIVFLAVVLACAGCGFGLAVPQGVSSCNGAFDVYFVLDLSSSLLRGSRNHFKEETVSFVKVLVDKFTSPLLRLSFITFNNFATVVMDLTNDRLKVEKKLHELRHAIPDGMTKLGLGLGKVNDQIRRYGEKRASVVIVLTDGILEYNSKIRAVAESDKARVLGATIIAVGVGDFDPSQLLEIVGGSKQLLFQAASFHGLNQIVRRVIDGSCVEIVSAQPGAVCANKSFELDITGKGFNKSGNFDLVMCNYWMNDEKSFLVTPTSFGATHLTCSSPDDVIFSPGDTVVLQVTLNGGISFISSNVTITAGECLDSSGVTWAIFLFLGLLLIAALWWFWNILCCVVVVEAKPKPQRPTPPPPPAPPVTVLETQQWPTVDASFYGGRGAGGVHPMKVKWGDRGCTEGAMHLERTKDAKEVGFVAKEVAVDHKPKPKRPPAPPQKTSCCGNIFMTIFGPIISFLRRLSMRRPTSEDLGKCIIIKPSVDLNRSRSSNASLTGGYLDTTN